MIKKVIHSRLCEWIEFEDLQKMGFTDEALGEYEDNHLNFWKCQNGDILVTGMTNEFISCMSESDFIATYGGLNNDQ